MAEKANDLGIEVKDGRVSMDIKNAEIARVIEEIARKAGIDFFMDQGVHGKVSIKISGATIEDTLKILCESRAIVFKYLPEKRSYRILSVGAYSGEKDTEKTGENDRTSSQPDSKLPSKHTKQDADRLAQGMAGERQEESEKLYDSRGRPLYKQGELLVRFKKGVTEEQIEALHRSIGSIVLKRMNRLMLQRVKLQDGLSEREAIEFYLGSGLVEVAERHALRYKNIVPNDEYFGAQWGLIQINAPEAWDMIQGSSEIIIAVIDTGVDYLHPDLENNIWINTAELYGTSGVDDDENGYIDDIYGWDFGGTRGSFYSDIDADPMDVDGHGTHIAGIIGAVGNNNIGVAGVNWNVKIMILKVQADDSDYMENWAIIEAIEYALNAGARIVNCSFGGDEYSINEEDAFIELRNANILAVCAAGNEGVDTDEKPIYPSGYDLGNIISVAASNQSDYLAYFSNYGTTSVDVMAPGTGIKSTVPAGIVHEASVTVESESGTTQYFAIEMRYAGTTDENGVTGLIYDCGEGWPDEFPSEVDGYTALIKRSEKEQYFYFSEKVSNAQEARAAAVIIYNNVTDDLDEIGGTLGTPGDWVPAVSISKKDGDEIRTLIQEGPGNPSVTVVSRMILDPSAYGTKQGTSMATPYVTGIAGLILSKNPDLAYAEVKSAIIDTVDKIPSVTNKIMSGGRVNASNALLVVRNRTGDLTCDGRIDLEDIIVALRVVSGLNTNAFSTCITTAVDVNGDGRIGIEEVIYVLQELGGFDR